MSTDFRSENDTKDATNSEKLILFRNSTYMQRFFEENLAVRQGYRLTCIMSNLTEQAFYAGVGTISPYSHRNNDSCSLKTYALSPEGESRYSVRFSFFSIFKTNHIRWHENHIQDSIAIPVYRQEIAILQTNVFQTQ